MFRCVINLLAGVVSFWLVTSMPAIAAAEDAGAVLRVLSDKGGVADLRPPKISWRDRVFAGCLERLSSSDKRIEYRTISGGRVTMDMEGGRMTSASNGRLTATAVFKGANATQVRLSNGRTFEVRKNMTDEERAGLPEKFKRMNRHVARVLVRECNLGINVSEAKWGFMRVSDAGGDFPGDWDSAYETEEFFRIYWQEEFDLSEFWAAAELPRRTCIVLENACRNLCESSKDYGNVMCMAAGGALALTFPIAGLLYGIACAGGVMALTNSCLADCPPSQAICD